MRTVAATCLSLSVVSIFLVLEGGAQERPAGSRAEGPALSKVEGPTATTNDPRVGLKAGLRDADEAAKNMKRIATLPKPEGFFDPKAPGGAPTPPERDPNLPPLDPNAPPDPRFANMLAFANSDLAFSGNHLFMGSFHGFTTYDIERPGKPRLSATVVCPGGQGDVSVHGNLLFMSVEQTRGRIDCGVQGVATPVSAERFRGVRIFDISEISKPRQVAAVQTCRGSHTHTLVTDPKDPANLYVYGSGTSSVRSAEELAGCSGLRPEEDPNTALFSIDVIQVPLASPERARIVNRPRIFADIATGAIAGLEKGGDRGPSAQPSRATNQCHDITVFPEVGLAAGACSGNGILLDIRDPKNPVRLDHVSDKNFAYWHSATFNNDATKVIFTDEWGGGVAPRCRATDKREWGADAIFTIADKRALTFHGYYKVPVQQTSTENCVAHNGNVIPVPGRDIMIQGWYQGGVSLFEFTDPAHAREIAYFDRGPMDSTKLEMAGSWSAYWYNGYIYSTEISRGLDVFELQPSALLTQNEIDAAKLVKFAYQNVQDQQRATWPASFVVARAYLDQLERSKGLTTDRIGAARSILASAETRSRDARRTMLTTLATDLERDAAKAADGAKVRAL